MLGTQYDKGKRQSYSTTFPIETTTSLPLLGKKRFLVLYYTVKSLLQYCIHFY